MSCQKMTNIIRRLEQKRKVPSICSDKFCLPKREGLIMTLNIAIREIEQKEIESTLCLVWRVFREYEAPDYTKEGVEEFYKSIHDKSYLSKLCLYGAFVQKELVGVIATRSEGTHIALFFVEGKYQRQGIGKQLFQRVWTRCSFAKMTVNSSPYAAPIYHKLGFRDTDIEQVVNGLRFTPMELEKQFVEARGVEK